MPQPAGGLRWGALPEASGYASILVTYNGEAHHLVQKPTGQALFNHVRECGFMSVNTLVCRELHVAGVAGGPGTGPGEQPPLNAPARPLSRSQSPPSSVFLPLPAPMRPDRCPSCRSGTCGLA